MFLAGCRRPSELESSLSKCRESGLKGGSYECLELDLMALKSVRKFAKAILEKNLPIHVLVNNGRCKVIRIRLGTPEKVNKCRLHQRCLDDVTTPPKFSG